MNEFHLVRAYNMAISDVLLVCDLCIANTSDQRGTLQILRNELVNLLRPDPPISQEIPNDSRKPTNG